MTAQTKNIKLKNKGFTLIELLVVIGILAILLAITLIAINPARQFAQARDTQRQSDVNAILNAVHQYLADEGELPGDDLDPDEITTTVANIANTGADICADLVPTYIAELPGDPDSTGPFADCTVAYDTEYTIVRSATDDRVTITAPNAEIETSISVTR